MPKKATPNGADVLEMTIKKAVITLQGDSPLIVHAWDEKAKQQILDKQMKKARGAKEAKDPNATYEACFYRTPDGAYGFPAVAFKAAAVDACSHVSDITKVAARGAFHIQGETLPLTYESITRRSDMVRIAMGTADVRIRPQFNDWGVVFTIRYNANVLSLEQLATLFNTAGFAVGVGEWRPEKNGSNGMFHVVSAVEVSE